jgi:hypothetical protein
MLSAIRTGAFLFAAATLGLTSSAHAQWNACKDDAALHCPGMKLGSAAELQCLKGHEQQLSPHCKKALSQTKSKVEEEVPKELEKNVMPPR